MKTKTCISMPHFYYVLKGTFYRSMNNPDDLIEINQQFIEHNPIEARTRVFEVYQNFLDVLLQSKGEVYNNHDQARKILNNFMLNSHGYENNMSTNFSLFTQDNKNHMDFDKGLSIYLVMTNSETFTTLEGEMIYNDKLLLHDLNSQLNGLKESMYTNLVKEYQLYEELNYDCADYITTFPATTNLNPDDSINLLNTPIDYYFEYLLKNI